MIYVVLSGILARLLERAKTYTTEMKPGRIDRCESLIFGYFT